VSARLVELDPRNAALAREAIAAAQLREQVEVVEADAAEPAVYEGAVPAQVVLSCGIFGNITDDDIHRTIDALPSFCERQATVVWTRHRLDPDLPPTIRRWFGEAGFSEQLFHAPDGWLFGVGAHRLEADPIPFPPLLDGDGSRLFTFFH
jgi:hypothetical protein